MNVVVYKEKYVEEVNKKRNMNNSIRRKAIKIGRPRRMNKKKR